MTPFDFLIASLASWGLAYLITREEAPFRLMARIRTRWTLGGLLTCIKCAALWTAALIVFLLPHPADLLLYLVYVFAVRSAGLMLATYSGMNSG